MVQDIYLAFLYVFNIFYLFICLKYNMIHIYIFKCVFLTAFYNGEINFFNY